MLLLAVILPFWISFLLRVYAWIGLLNNRGVINEFCSGPGVIDEPLAMLYNDFAVYLGIVYSYLPFMILPLYSNLERLDLDLLDAAADLGARRWQAFIDVTLPLSVPGIIGGCLLVFIPAVGEFTIPALLGGADTLMIGRVLWDEFFISRDWPVASAVSIVLLLLLVAPIMWFQRARDPRAGGRRDEAPLAGALSDRGVRLRVALRPDPLGRDLLVQRLAARDAVGRLFAALVREPARGRGAARGGAPQPADRGRERDLRDRLGALVALALQRLTRLRGRLLLVRHDHGAAGDARDHHGPVAPVPVHLDGGAGSAGPTTRGATTITIAHITFSMAYVAVVVRSRLAGMDESLEEAAMDLGGRPLAVFFDVTVPMLLPALVSGLAARVHAVAGRSRDLELRVRAGGDDAADADLRQGAAGRDTGHQRDRDHHHRAGRGRGRDRGAD